MTNSIKAPCFLSLKFPEAVANGVLYELDIMPNTDKYAVVKVVGDNSYSLNEIHVKDGIKAQIEMKLGNYSKVLAKIDPVLPPR